jgi:peptide-methionine (S)-S-oxide reductase
MGILIIICLISISVSATELELATFGGGCFWCLEAVYVEAEGVEKVVSGYSGGPDPNPTYSEICTGRTGHAEVVQISYNPDKISFKELIEIFFVIHDPTTLNRQGNDVGTQYRSIIFYHSNEQKEISEELIRFFEEEKAFPSQIVTEITSLEAFYIAEEEHQNYYANNPSQGYCRVVIAPKVNKFRSRFMNKLKIKK